MRARPDTLEAERRRDVTLGSLACEVTRPDRATTNSGVDPRASGEHGPGMVRVARRRGAPGSKGPGGGTRADSVLATPRAPVRFRARALLGRPSRACAKLMAVATELEHLEHDAVADTSRSLTVRSRGLVYAVAGALLAVAVVLAALRVGERAGRLSDWQALVLGVTQGASELLPISSSGHLILVPWIANWHYLEQHPIFNKTFDVSLHLGTLVAVVAYFWGDVVRYTSRGCARCARGRSATATSGSRGRSRSRPSRPRSSARSARTRSTTTSASRGRSRSSSRSSPSSSGSPTARRSAAPSTGFGLPTAVAIGISQILALMPGVSRSGITITTGRFAKLDRDAAARFSFLLLIPIVLGAVLYKGLKHVVLNPLPAGSAGPFIVGTIASAAVGLVAIDLLLGYVRQAQLPAVRDLPPRPRRADRDRDRERLARQHVLDD